MVDRDTFIEEMEGFLTEETKRETTARITPETMKADWTSDLPSPDPDRSKPRDDGERREDASE